MFPHETRILVIDDMPSIRDLVKNHLKAMGFKSIQEASDGEEALRMLIQNNTPSNRTAPGIKFFSTSSNLKSILIFFYCQSFVKQNAY